MKTKIILLLSGILILLCEIGYGQICTPGNSCFDAPLICGSELDGYSYATGSPNDITQPDIFCGVIENNQWIRFVACESEAVIELIVNSCQGTLTGSGLQAEIFSTDDCFNFTSVSNCLSSPVAQNGTLNASGLTPGDIYYLMIDGWAADICEYTIDIISGIDTDPPNPVVLNPGTINGSSTVCPGETVTYSVNPPQCSNASVSGCPLPELPAGDFSYEWILPANATALSTLDDAEVTVLWGSTGGTVDVILQNNSTVDCNCDWTCSTEVNPLNVSVSNNPVSADTLATIYICEGETVDFCGQTYSTTTNAVCSDDCITGTIQPIVVLPSSYTDLGTITLCNGECFTINGENYCDGGFQTSNVQDAESCEVTGFTINQVTIDGYFEAVGTLTPSITSIEIIGGGNTSSGGSLSFEWSGPGIDPDQINEQNPMVTAPGTYTVIVTDTSTGCSVEIFVTVSYQDNDCNLPVAPSDTCAGAPLLCGPVLDGYCSFTDQYTASSPGNLSSEFCYTIENNSWLKFIPCEPTVELSISVGECALGQGVEAVVLATDDCEQFQRRSNCIQTDSTETDTLTATNLIPGEIYYLMLDGIAGASCNWEVNLVSGISVDAITLTETEAAEINGSAVVCLGEIQTYTLTPPVCELSGGDDCPYANALNDLEIEWILPYGATMISNNGLSIEIAWENGSGGNLGAIVSTALSNGNTFCSADSECGGYVYLPVIVNYYTNTLPPVYLCEGESFEFCGVTYAETIDASCADDCGQTVQPIIVEQDQFTDMGTIYLCEGSCFTYDNVVYCEEGTVALVDSSGVCTNTTEFTLAFVEEDSLVVSPAIEDCDVLGISYRVVFDITSGVPPYYVNGTLLDGTTFTSSPILSGEPYYFEITNSPSCGDPIVIREGQVACNCMTEAGTMNPDTLVSCDGETIQVEHSADEFLDSDDTYEYILHLGSSDELIDPIEINFSGAFDFIPGVMEYGQVYYVSYVAGNAIDGGFVDLNALCLSVAPGQPIVFIPQPYAIAGTGFTLDCNTPEMNLNGSVLNDLPGVVHEWTGPNDFSSETLSPVVTAAGMYVLSVQDSLVGCLNQDTVIINGDFTIPEISSDDVILNCNNPADVLVASAVDPSVDFNWLLPDSTLQSGNSLTVQSPGNFLLFGVAINGCRDTLTVQAIDGFKYPDFTASGGIINCYEPTVELSVSNPDTDYNYSWTGPDAFSSDLSNPAVTIPGIYTLEVSNELSGCRKDTAVLVEDQIVFPLADLGENLTLDCNQPEQSIIPVSISQGENIQYAWTGPDDFSSNESAPLVTQGGAYELIITDTQNGCSTSGFITIVEDFTPPQLEEIEPKILNCYQPEISLTGSSSTSGTDIIWLLPAGDSLSNASILIDAGGTYQVLASAPNGCTSSLPVIVAEQFHYPEITASGGTLDCYTPDIYLESSSSLTNVTYQWTGPANYSSEEAQALVRGEGAYSLVVTDTASGCASDTTVLVFNEIAFPLVEIGEADLLTCKDTIVELSASSDSEGAEVLYTWSNPEGATIQNAESLTPSVSEAGWYYLEVINVSNGCTTLDSVVVLQNPDVPQEILSDIEPLRCHGDSDGIIYIDDIAGGEGPYQYAFNAGEWGATSTLMNLPAGTYQLAIQDANGCVIEQSLDIAEPPLVEVSLPENYFINFGETVDLEADISIPLGDLTVLQWTTSTGDAFEGNANWTVQPFYSTTYNINVADENNCRDTAQVRIFVNRDMPVYIPNAFSPDGDGHNDFFTLFASPAITRINTLRVYDRWGELLFQRDDFAANDPSLGWDGKFRGEKMNSGVFVYYAEVETIEGLSVPFQGDVSILR